MHTHFKSEVGRWCPWTAGGEASGLWPCARKERQSVCRFVPAEPREFISRAEQGGFAIPAVLFPVLTFSSQDSADLLPQDVQVLCYLGFDVKRNPTVQKRRPVRTGPASFSVFLCRITKTRGEKATFSSWGKKAIKALEIPEWYLELWQHFGASTLLLLAFLDRGCIS